MTEEEAKTKWCPHAQSFYWAGSEIKGQPVSVNRYVSEGDEVDGKPHAIPTTPHADCLCIGSACMAWRWDATTASRKRNLPGSVSTGDEGFCGLAGKP